MCLERSERNGFNYESKRKDLGIGKTSIILKKVLMGVGFIVTLMLLMSGTYLYKFNSETSKMHPSDTKEIIESIYVVKGDTFVNFYLVKNGNEYVAIDSGNNLNMVKQEMVKLKIDITFEDLIQFNDTLYILPLAG